MWAHGAGFHRAEHSRTKNQICFIVDDRRQQRGEFVGARALVSIDVDDYVSAVGYRTRSTGSACTAVTGDRFGHDHGTMLESNFARAIGRAVVDNDHLVDVLSEQAVDNGAHVVGLVERRNDYRDHRPASRSRFSHSNRNVSLLRPVFASD